MKMNSVKRDGWICRLLPEKREYRINGVTYIVAARFEKSDSENSIRSRFERIINNEMIDLTTEPPCDKIVEENVYSAAGKEE